MDEKIAVGASVVAGYRFGFGRLGAVIGAVWLPLVLVIGVSTAISLATTFAVMKSTAFGIQDGTTMAAAGFALTPVNLLIEAVFGSMAAVGVMSIALGRREPGFVYFSFGPAVRRMIAANLLVLLVLVALGAVLLAVFALGAHGMGIPFPRNPTEWLIFPLRQLIYCSVARGACSPLSVFGLLVVLFIGLALVVYVVVRLTFFLPAVVVWEERIGLGRAWSLSRGQFWRIFAIWLGVAIPLVIAVAVVQHFTTQWLFTTTMPKAQAMTLALQGMPLFLVMLSVIKLVEDVLTVGLGSGAQAHAYTKLTMADAPDVF